MGFAIASLLPMLATARHGASLARRKTMKKTDRFMRLSLLALFLATSSAHASMPLAACDAPNFATVLRAAPGRMEARAVWLDGSHIRWPGVDAGATFRLYASPDGAIVARKGEAIAGAAAFVELKAVPGQPSERFKFVGDGVTLAMPAHAPLHALHDKQLVLAREAADGTVVDATRVQAAGALDELFASAGQVGDLGATVGARGTVFKLWAPTAQQVAVCTYDSGYGKAMGVAPMERDPGSGVWRIAAKADLTGKYYKYAVDVLVDGVGLVRNLVTDPYSISLSTDSARSYIADLDAPATKPAGWDKSRAPATVKALSDMTVYELHVRDFSINDSTVTLRRRGKFAAFTEPKSDGMRHLAALARAGLTDIHLLPIYDFGSVPEAGCAVPSPSGAADSEAQQALVKQTAETDCFNWGYDPVHYSAPEGSYATDPSDGARRIVEMRQMVMQLHRLGLRVGMDVVYNHTYRAGQHAKSVLDRIVPGYYHRLNAAGAVETSTCCDNTATENRMMAKLMTDSVALWARQYKIDSFRFDLMGHQPRDVMERLQARVDEAAGRHVQLIGEGWNFGEVADGARFVQASQLSLNGSGIGTFSDRARDAVRGGSAADSGETMIKAQGYINGLVYAPNALAGQHPAADLLKAADMVRVGLAGSIRSYPLKTWQDELKLLEKIDYNGQPAGYASAPGEAVNYVENHDNQTLFDMNVFKLPVATSSADRARVQMLGAAINALSQGVAYFHAGIDTLRSKSLDRNSFNSGDWFNRIDWRYQDNYFGTGLPPADDNGKDYALMRPLLANPAIKPQPADIAFARDVFRDLLAVRASTTLLRLRTSEDIRQRLRFFNTGSKQEATVIAAHIDGKDYPGARFGGLAYFINVDKTAHTLAIPELTGRKLRLHPAQRADKRVLEAKFDQHSGAVTIPARTAVVFVE
jgi:pullulanase